ncbi:MAG: hypothetical protein U5L96_06645 [Owenweeksia sp.]|nr:hypothetical protein [Owenweeksia sp.]
MAKSQELLVLFAIAWVVLLASVAVPDPDLSLSLKKTLERNRYEGEVFITALTEKDYLELAGYGDEKILRPHQMAASNFYRTFLKDRIP